MPFDLRRSVGREVGIGKVGHTPTAAQVQAKSLVGVDARTGSAHSHFPHLTAESTTRGGHPAGYRDHEQALQ